MGTNFYAYIEPTSGRTIHLGKRSAGWKFCFHRTGHFSTVRELVGWLENTPGVTIIDEYGDRHDIVDWVRMATTWGEHGHLPGRGCHCGDDVYYHGRPWPRIDAMHYTDPEGYAWSSGEFS